VHKTIASHIITHARSTIHIGKVREIGSFAARGGLKAESNALYFGDGCSNVKCVNTSADDDGRKHSFFVQLTHPHTHMCVGL